MFLAVSTFAVTCVVQEDWVSHEKATTSNHEPPGAMSNIRQTSSQRIGGGNVPPNRLQCPRRSLPTAQKTLSRPIPPRSHVTGWEQTARARKPISLPPLIIHRVDKTLRFFPVPAIPKTEDDDNDDPILLLQQQQQQPFNLPPPLPPPFHDPNTTTPYHVLSSHRSDETQFGQIMVSLPRWLARIDVCGSTMPACRVRVHGAGGFPYVQTVFCREGVRKRVVERCVDGIHTGGEGGGAGRIYTPSKPSMLKKGKKRKKKENKKKKARVRTGPLDTRAIYLMYIHT